MLLRNCQVLDGILIKNIEEFLTFTKLMLQNLPENIDFFLTQRKVTMKIIFTQQILKENVFLMAFPFVKVDQQTNHIIFSKKNFGGALDNLVLVNVKRSINQTNGKITHCLIFVKYQEQILTKLIEWEILFLEVIIIYSLP